MAGLGLLCRQTPIPAQPAALVATDGGGCQCSELTGAIGFEEGLGEKAQRFEPRENLAQFWLGFYATEDQVRMIVTGWKRACDFDARVAGLNCLLRK